MTDLYTIDRQPAIDLFRAMLGAEQHEHVLQLIGDAKMGKTHMLRVYRYIAEEEWQASCALVDLRAKLQDYGDLLDIIAQQITPTDFVNYEIVHNELASRPRIQVSGLTALLSRVSLSTPNGEKAEQHRRRRLTQAFLQDITNMPQESPIILLFDAFEQAEKRVREWLNEHLFTGLSRIPHVWVVVAGRELPDPLATWHDSCCKHRLLAVSLDDHRQFCTDIQAELTDEQIKALHEVLDGAPGQFVELVAPKYGRRGVRV